MAQATRINELERIAGAMAEHAQENPKHGYNCACKDHYVQQAKQWYDRQPPEAQREMLYLFTMLLRY